MNKVKMIATDIDGTILKYDFNFNQTVIDCIKNLSKNDVKVILITGRMHNATKFIADELGLETPIVSYHGGLVRENTTEAKILYERYVKNDFAEEIIKWAKENDVHINVYLDDRLYVEKEDKIIIRYATERCVEYNIAAFDTLNIDKVNKIVAIDFENPERVKTWVETLRKKYPELYIVNSTPHFCEICNKESTKGHAVKFLMDYYGFSQEEVMTIGDQNNDIELLQSGGIPVAMGNATEELKCYAKFITDTVDNDGFVRAVEKFCRV